MSSWVKNGFSGEKSHFSKFRLSDRGERFFLEAGIPPPYAQYTQRDFLRILNIAQGDGHGTAYIPTKYSLYAQKVPLRILSIGMEAVSVYRGEVFSYNFRSRP